VVDSGQHYHPELTSDADVHLGVGSGPHGQQTGRALERFERVLIEENPLIVVVPGDTNTALAGALAASKLGIPIAHIESGLRSFDWTMPEEQNRVLIDRLAHWRFTHSPEARLNLSVEGITENVVAAGNTMIDTLAQTGVERKDRGYYLLTLHRPALSDNPELLHPILDAVASLGQVVWPKHPRVSLDGWSHPSLTVEEPAGYQQFIRLQAGATAVITDSGGVQEETTFLGVPCFTVRENTERPITVSHGTNTLLGLDPKRIRDIPRLLTHPKRPLPIAGWDGHAGERIAQILNNHLEGK
jgi:UDP-N-acetylglucosamine 2-epimerase (non-hydrolysing)